VDGDGYGDIVAPSFSGEVWSIHGENGHIVDNWPFYLEQRAFHATPLVYDVNRDGILEFLLATSDAEILFLHINNSLLHGETIKIPPLRVRRYWYKLDKSYIEKITQELDKQLGDSARLKPNDNYWLILQGPEMKDKDKRSAGGPPGTQNLHQHTEAFSEFESRYGLYADPLYSRHQTEDFITGVDPGDPQMVFVDPHILATPTLADINGDGFTNELIVPVSYYFDPFYYGDLHTRNKLGGLEQDELVNFVAGGIVVIDLNTGAIIRQKILGLTQASDSQPAYMLSTPTVVRLFPGVGGAVIITAMATGEVNMMEASSLESESGFPVHLDSVSAQVAVADLFQNGVLELVVGDNSGNVYCIDSHGQRIWEFEVKDSIQSTVRFADFNGDNQLDVIFVTAYGSLWVLHGTSGTPFPGFPIRLNTHIQSPPLLMHLSHSLDQKDTLTAILPSRSGIFVIDLTTQCVDAIPTDGIMLTVLSGDVDPYSPGIEIVAAGLDGHMMCFSAGIRKMNPQQIALESWSEDSAGHSRFVHKTDSLVVVLPSVNETGIDIQGSSFSLDVNILDNAARRSKQVSVSVAIGRKYLLYNETLPLYQQTTSHTLSIPTPPEPMAAFITVTFCSEHLQCDSISRHARFNLHFRNSLQWFLCGPFLALTAAFLWLLRDAHFEPLPGFSSSNRKVL
jgi:hypothetical protein